MPTPALNYHSLRHILVIAAAVALPVLLISCGIGQGRDQTGNVAVRILGTAIQSGSNIVTFSVTNGFEFPIIYAANASTKNETSVWRTVYHSGKSVTLIRGQIEARSTKEFSWTLPPTNRWKIQVSYRDSRNPVFRKRIQGYVDSQEIEGGSVITPAR